MNSQICKIKIGKRFRSDLGDIESLAKSIKRTKGLIHPIILDKHGKLVAGRRRLEACKKLGLKTVPTIRLPFAIEEIYPFAEIEENTERKDFTASEIGRIKEALAKLVKPGRPKKGANLAELTGDLRDTVATISNVSHGNVDKIDAIYQASKTDTKAKEILTKLDNREISVNTAFSELNTKTSFAKPLPLPPGTFNVIYADPPWPYDHPVTGGSNLSGVSNQYGTMTIDNICNMEIKKQFAEDSVLFLWATVPLLPEAFKVMEAWGYNYKTAIFWEKTTTLGLGYWFRGKVEVCLVGSRGEMKPLRCQKANYVKAKSLQHSQKPEEMRTLIEEATAHIKPLSRLELFARGKPIEGWTQWGAEFASVG